MVVKYYVQREWGFCAETLAEKSAWLQQFRYLNLVRILCGKCTHLNFAPPQRESGKQERGTTQLPNSERDALDAEAQGKLRQREEKMVINCRCCDFVSGL